MNLSGLIEPLLAFLIPGFREILVVAVVALVLYGRSGQRLLRMTPLGRSIGPWIDMMRVPEPAAKKGRPQARPPVPATDSSVAPNPGARERPSRWFWALTIVAATAVAAWIVTRTMIHLSASGP